MEYEIFEQKTIVGGNVKSKWYYSFLNPTKKRRTVRVCKGCSSYVEAENYCKKIKMITCEQYLIKNIAKDLFVKGRTHLDRMEGFGKKLDDITIYQRRLATKQIINDFGECDIRYLPIRDIEGLLIRDKKHSGSWKNFYLETFSCIYEETKWNCPTHVSKPKFQRFSKNSRKCDILTTKELEQLFQPKFWNSYTEYLLFVCIASCGLRIGEARALQGKQFLFDRKILVVNGFCKRDGTRTFYNKKGSIHDDKIRVVPLPDETIRLLKDFFQLQNIMNDDFVFQNKNGCPIDKDHLEHVFKVTLKKAKINVENRKIVPHSLRYTYVTRMRRGLAVEDVQRLVGHSSIEMTEYYTRSTLPELIASVQGSFESANNLFSD